MSAPSSHKALKTVCIKDIEELPIQTFTNLHSIDWTQPLPDISSQLYCLYNLSECEVAFIQGFLTHQNIKNSFNNKIVANNGHIHLPYGISIPATYLPYTLNNTDIDLIKSLANILPNFPSDLPIIEVTDATPPAMQKSPMSIWGLLKQIPGENDDKRIRNIKNNLPEEYWQEALGYGNIYIRVHDVELILGLYDSSKRKIVLFERGILAIANKLKVDKDILRAVVLVHELGHWLSHIMPQGCTAFWEDAKFDNATNEVCEGWAQLLDYWAVTNNINSTYRDVFDKLNDKQSYPYKVYLQFIQEPHEKMLDSLEAIRVLSQATEDDWKTLV